MKQLPISSPLINKAAKFIFARPLLALLLFYASGIAFYFMFEPPLGWEIYAVGLLIALLSGILLLKYKINIAALAELKAKFKLPAKTESLTCFKPKTALHLRCLKRALLLLNIALLCFLYAGLSCQIKAENAKTELSLHANQYADIIGLVCRPPQASADSVRYVIAVRYYCVQDVWRAEDTLLQMTIYNKTWYEKIGESKNAAQAPQNNGSADIYQQSEQNITGSDNRSQPLYKYGDKLKISGKLVLPGGLKNPGQFNYANYLQRQGISLLISTDDKNITVLDRQCGHPIKQLLYDFRDRLAAVFDRLFPAEQAALLKAMVFGDTSGLEEQNRMLFTNSGLIHILCVSGLHVGLLFGFISQLLNLAGLRYYKKTKAAISLLLLVMYAVMTGLEPPVIRAVVMIAVIIMGKLINKNSSWPENLALAALLLLLVNPYYLLDIGFQLSFISTWGICRIGPVLIKLMPKIPAIIAGPLAITLAAQLASLPLILYYYYQLPLYSPLFNLAATPLIAVIMPLAFITALVGLVWLPAAAVISAGLSMAVDLLLLLTELADKLPGAVVNIYLSGQGQAALYYIILLIIIWCLEKGRNRRELQWLVMCRYPRQCLAAAAIIAAVIIINSIVDSNELKVHFIDVGQGDSMVIQLPNNKNILLDAGGNPNNREYDIGEQAVVPYLKMLRIKQLDLLVISHPDYDHYGGAQAVTEKFKVKRVVLPALKGEEAEYLELLDTVAARNIPVTAGSSGLKFVLGTNITLTVLHPGENYHKIDRDSNNNSLIIRLDYKDISFLFTGDVEAGVLRRLLKNGAEPVDVVKVAHHGSRYSYDSDFYRRLKPAVAVISVGKNSYGHPAEEVVRGLAETGCEVYQTLQSGAITICSNGSYLKVKTTVD